MGDRVEAFTRTRRRTPPPILAYQSTFRVSLPGSNLPEKANTSRSYRRADELPSNKTTSRNRVPKGILPASRRYVPYQHSPPDSTVTTQPIFSLPPLNSDIYSDESNAPFDIVAMFPSPPPEEVANVRQPPRVGMYFDPEATADSELVQPMALPPPHFDTYQGSPNTLEEVADVGTFPDSNSEAFKFAWVTELANMDGSQGSSNTWQELADVDTCPDFELSAWLKEIIVDVEPEYAQGSPNTWG